MKVYKLWSPVTTKKVYCQDVVFRQIKEVPKQEGTIMEKDLDTIVFELED